MEDKLKNILTDPRDFKTALSLITNISKSYKILFIGLTGSTAHGTATENSDLDFSIVYAIPSMNFSHLKKDIFGVNVVRLSEDFEKLDKNFLNKHRDITFQVDDNAFNKCLDENLVLTIKYNRINKEELKFDCEAKEIRHLVSQLPDASVLELFNLPEEAIVYKDPLFEPFLKNKDLFLGLDSKKPFLNYSYMQIAKMLNDNKKFNIDPETFEIRKSPLEYISVLTDNGKENLVEWLTKNRMHQKFCGVVPIPHNHDKLIGFIKYHFNTSIFDLVYLKLSKTLKTNIASDKVSYWRLLSTHLSTQLQLLSAAGHNTNLDKTSGSQYRYSITYGLFYDWNAHKRFNDSSLTPEQMAVLKNKYKGTFKGFKGIMKESDGELISNEIRLSSIPKNDKLLALMVYDKNGYSTYCKDYKNYFEWVKNRNVDRYKLNLEHGQNGDTKNAQHAIRIIETYLEVLSTGKLRVLRAERRQFYLDIKSGKYPITDILEMCNGLASQIEALYESNPANLPETGDYELLKSLITDLRNAL